MVQFSKTLFVSALLFAPAWAAPVSRAAMAVRDLETRIVNPRERARKSLNLY